MAYHSSRISMSEKKTKSEENHILPKLLSRVPSRASSSMSLLPRALETHRCPRKTSNVPNAASPRARVPSGESHLPSPSRLVFRRRPITTATTRHFSSTAGASASASASNPSESSPSSRCDPSETSTSPKARSSSSASSSSSPRAPWRLGPYLSPPLALLAAALEGAWHASLKSSGLELVSLDPGVQYRDSVEPVVEEEEDEGKKEEDVPDFDFEGVEDMRAAVEAIKRQETARLAKINKTRLVVENRIYSSRVFRKIHLELALRGDGLQVLHCVLFPRLEFDLPILSMDLVAAPTPPTGKANSPEEASSSSAPASSSSSSDPEDASSLMPQSPISLAVIDPCPARLDGSLPEPYRDVVFALQKECGVASNRAQPEWGREIFSDACILTRPAGDEELLKRFLRYALSLHAAHLTFAESLASNLADSRRGKSRQQRLQERAATAAAHSRYREKQLQNGATRGVLAAAFGKEWADSYMETVMFDVEEF